MQKHEPKADPNTTQVVIRIPCAQAKLSDRSPITTLVPVRRCCEEAAVEARRLYPFIHLGGEGQMWDKFLAQRNSSGQGGIRTRDFSIPKPASYHKTTAPQ
ncbi:hypothetical protein DPMN_131486 [Dreissena polymorpha]|uniref:Uncharacterized protein n=1 Tax=Dreissena polymorpha TaxID=45954 RepID=A0A9D4JYI4_DREPO|nr:hypothetical protein DPMN_131486 [Dreissena polymorpha]